MRKVFILIVLMGAFISCSKKDAVPTSPALVTSFKFNANGISYSIDSSLANNANTGSIIKKVLPNNNQPNPQVQGYELSAHTNGSYVLALFIPSNTDLTPTTYSINRSIYPSGEYTVFWAPGRVQYGHFRSGDFMTITISKIENGYASGTFTASYSGQTPTQIENITDGTFQNVKILN